GGLERALQLAEAMTARGFGGQPARRGHAHIGPALVIGLACILVAGVAQLVPAWGMTAPIFLLLGTGLIGWTIWRAGQAVHHTRYRRHAWRWTDIAIVISAVFALLPLLIWGETRVYSPYPRLTWPGFDLRSGGALLALMLPAIVRRLRQDDGTRSHAAHNPSPS
ncbi:MAG: hypothetical protein JXC32_08100, partial [Anaerolineae bacterium]|nr:hypothetical protein [Anaerolineae bacterium]